MSGKEEEEYCNRLVKNPKYNVYIQNHLADLRSKCNHLTVCINKLLSQMTPIEVLNGDDLELEKICELIDVPANNTESALEGNCYYEERLDIQQDIENHLKDKMDKKSESWLEVEVCLENNYGDTERTTYVKDLCGLVKKEGQACTKSIHRKVQRFFNEQVDHLHCTCKALNADSSEGLSKASIAFITTAAVLFVLIIGIIAYCCVKKKQKKKKKKKGPSVIYLPSGSAENCPVYQEIFDQGPPPGIPPALPSRYNSRPLPGHPDDTEYLEPVQAQAALNSYRSKAPGQKLVHNPGYNVDAPPEYSETDQTYEDAVLMNPEEVGAYFEPLESPKQDQTQGYDTLDVRENNTGDNTSQTDEYQPLQDIDADTDKKLGPSPAERTKKADRQQESEYFELEREQTTV